MKVSALDIYGKEHFVDSSKLIFRPTAYAIFIKDNKTLVLKTMATGKWQFAGGGVDANEVIEEGLKREVKEELGIDCRIEKFIHFYESNYFHGPDTWDCPRYFYLCASDNYFSLNKKEIKDEQAGKAQWLEVKDLNENNFQYPQFGILPIIKSLIKG